MDEIEYRSCANPVCKRKVPDAPGVRLFCCMECKISWTEKVEVDSHSNSCASRNMSRSRSDKDVESVSEKEN